LILISCLLLISCKKENTEIRILFTGDILLFRNVKKEYDYRKISPWEELKPFFQQADIVVGNLEGAVGSIRNNAFNTPLVFSIDSCDVRLLQDAGFNAITIANNHSMDLGDEGKNRTKNTLIGNGIHPVDFENSPCFFTVKNVVEAIIAVNNVLDKTGSRNEIPSIELQQKLRLAKALSHIVIVSIHWGSELLEWTNKEQREIAGWLTGNGADVIIGSHPHVVQPPEMVNGKPVFFSLGNHLFDQKYLASKRGLIAEIKIKNNTYSCSGFYTQTKRNSFYPAYSDKSDFKTLPIKLKKELFEINNYTLFPQSIPQNGKTILHGYKDNRLAWKSHPITLTSIFSSKLHREKNYLLTLEKHYSPIDKEINIRPYVYSIEANGLISRWRGSALALPLLDAQISLIDENVLCALHRGDSFIMLNPKEKGRKIMGYKWNGFGFQALPDSLACEYCGRNFD